MFSRSRNLPLDLTCKPVLHWLLLLALLVQSLGPVAMAAAAPLHPQADTGESATGVTATPSEHGIWTVSCAGKPMWLPFPAQQHTDSGTMALPDHAHRACLFCKNTSSDTALPAIDFASAWLPAASFHSRAVSAATVHSPLRQQYHPRAPPVFLQH